MGEYQLAEDHSDDVSLTVNNWYRHVDREDRFLMYNNLGNILKDILLNFGLNIHNIPEIEYNKKN